MFNFQRGIAASVVVFCLMAVISVAAANTDATTQFMESSWSFFFPSPAQSNQNVDNQPLDSGPFVSFDPASYPATLPSYPYWWAFDTYFNPIIREGYVYNENDTACGNCGPVPPGSFADPLGVDQLRNGPETPLTHQSPFIEEAWQGDPLDKLISCGNCGPGPNPFGEFL